MTQTTPTPVKIHICLLCGRNWGFPPKFVCCECELADIERHNAYGDHGDE